MSTDLYLSLANEKPGVRSQQVQRGITCDKSIVIIQQPLFTCFTLVYYLMILASYEAKKKQQKFSASGHSGL